MNRYIDAQILNMMLIARTFKQSCTMAATKDDGTVDRHEKEVIHKIDKCTEKFIHELEKIRKNM